MPYDEAFPARVQLARPGVVLNVYDDGDDFSIMAVAHGAKAGTGTGASIREVQASATALIGLA